MSAAKWVRATITVPVALQEAANMLAAELDFDDGADTFSVPLGPEGAIEPTDFGCCTLLRPHTADQVATHLLPQFAGARFYSEVAGWDFMSALADAGLTVLTPS